MIVTEKLDNFLVLLDIMGKRDEILSSYNTIIVGGELISLDLIGTGITSLPDYSFDQFLNLEKIYLSHNHIQKLEVAVFKNMKNLLHIDLRGTGLTSIHPDQFKSQFKLHRLELNDNRLSFLPSGVFDNLYSLQELNLSNNKLTELEPTIFDNLSHLERLYLYFNPFPKDLAHGDYYDRETVEEVIKKIKKIFE